MKFNSIFNLTMNFIKIKNADTCLKKKFLINRENKINILSKTTPQKVELKLFHLRFQFKLLSNCHHIS